MKWKTILNPFEKYSEKQLMIFGIIVIFFSVVLQNIFQYYNNLELNGPDSQVVSRYFALRDAAVQILKFLILFSLLMALGKYINSKTRAIDIFNVIAVSKYPSVILYFLDSFKNRNTIIQKGNEIAHHIKQTNFETFLNILVGTFSVLLAFHVIELLFKGFKTATNMKKSNHYILFVFAILIIITISFIIRYQLKTNFTTIPTFLQ